MGINSEGLDEGLLVATTIDTVGTVDLGYIRGPWNLTVGGATSVTAALQRSFDGGTTYYTLHVNGLPVSPPNNSSEQFYECEGGVLYRLNVTAISGTLSVRASR